MRKQGSKKKSEMECKPGACPSFQYFYPVFILFFGGTHIDVGRPGCECVSESFPDEGDKVEVISRALIQRDSLSCATLGAHKQVELRAGLKIVRT